MNSWIRVCAVLLLLTLTLTLAACKNEPTTENGSESDTGSDTAPQTEAPNYDAEQVDPEDAQSAHYLLFCIDDTVVEKMLVLETDTYEGLTPFFPTIPKKEGYTARWESDITVYQDAVKEVRIRAIYEAIAAN